MSGCAGTLKAIRLHKITLRRTSWPPSTSASSHTTSRGAASDASRRPSRMARTATSMPYTRPAAGAVSSRPWRSTPSVPRTGIQRTQAVMRSQIAATGGTAAWAASHDFDQGGPAASAHAANTLLRPLLASFGTGRHKLGHVVAALALGNGTSTRWAHLLEHPHGQPRGVLHQVCCAQNKDSNTSKHVSFCVE